MAMEGAQHVPAIFDVVHVGGLYAVKRHPDGQLAVDVPLVHHRNQLGVSVELTDIRIKKNHLHCQQKWGYR